MQKNNYWKSAFFWALPLLFILIFYLYPILRVMDISFSNGSGINQVGSNTFGMGVRAVRFSLYQAALSTLLTMAIGFPAAFLFSRFRFPGQKTLRLLSTLPFILPTVVVAAGFNALIGPQGWINLLLMKILHLQQPPIAIFGTLPAILLAHVFYNTSVIIRVVGTAWERLHARTEDAARILGASPWKVFWKVTIPLLTPSILSALLLVFLFDFTSFGVILMMGSAKYSTIEVEIYIQTMQFLNLKAAGILALVQLIFSMLLTFLSHRMDQNSQSPELSVAGEENQKVPKAFLGWIFVLGMITLLIFLLVLPLGALVLRSITTIVNDETGNNLVLTLEHFRKIFINERDSLFYVPPFAAMKNSLIYAFSSMLISVGIGTLIVVNEQKNNLMSRILNSLVMLPLGTSAVTLGLGYLLAFASSPIGIGFYPLLIPVAHALISLPFVVRILHPAIKGIPANIHEAAMNLGVDQKSIWWKVDLPIIRKPIFTAAIYAFAISLGEFGASSFLSRPENPTMPVAIFRYLGLPGAENFGKAMAMSALLLMICAGAFLLIEKIMDIKEV